MRSKHDAIFAATRPRMAGRSRRRACMRPTRRHAHVAVLLAAALLPPTTTLSAQTTALRCGRLIDGISAEARENVTVIVPGRARRRRQNAPRHRPTRSPAPSRRARSGRWIAPPG